MTPLMLAVQKENMFMIQVMKKNFCARLSLKSGLIIFFNDYSC